MRKLLLNTTPLFRKVRQLSLLLSLLLVPQLAGAQTWPAAATPDNGTVVVTTTNGTELAATYAATRSYSFQLTGIGTSTVTYSSSVPAVATVNESTGDVAILKAGETIITATVDGTSTYTYKLTVKKAIATIAFSETNYFFVHQGTTKAIPVSTTPLKDEVTGEDIPLTYTLYPDNGHNTNGITINNSARTVTVTTAAEIYQHDGAIDFSDDANYKLADNTSAPRCSLKVVAPATELVIKFVDNNNQEVTSFEKTFGSTEVLPQLSDTPGYTGTITYTSSNEEVATVGASGDITLLRNGVTIITATTEETETYSSATTSFALTVHKASPTISFAKWNANSSNYTGGNVVANEILETTYGTTTFKAPKPTFNGGYVLTDTTRYTYSFAPEGIVEFLTETNNTGNPNKIVYTDLNILKAGEVTITCSFPGNLQNNPCSASYSLKVNKADLTDGTFHYSSPTYNAFIDVDRTTPKGGIPNQQSEGPINYPTLVQPTSGFTDISYESSDTDVASIDATGAITLNGKGGETIIKATVGPNDDRYNGRACSYQLTVRVPAIIEIGNSTASILNSETYTQTATVTPDGAPISYTSSGDNLATVDANGKVTPNSSFIGEVTIKARITNMPNTGGGYYYFKNNDPAFETTYVLTVSKNYDFSNIFTDASMTYATCIMPEPLTRPTGLKVYYITGTSGDKVTTEEIDYLPYGVPILLEKTAETFGAVTARTDSSAVISGNILQYAGATDKAINSITGGTPYILYKNEFVKATGASIKANKCYFVISSPNPARGFVIEGGNDGSTAIDTTLINNEGMVNEEWYDLQGRRIQKPTKPGLYIVNGKKVVVTNK